MLAHLKKDRDLDPIRQHPGYSKLVGEMEGKEKGAEE
jgi:hypothetical protein